MRMINNRIKRPRTRIAPPPGKSEKFWNRKAGEQDEFTGPIVGASLAVLDAKLEAIDAEHARDWPNALDLSAEGFKLCPTIR